MATIARSEGLSLGHVRGLSLGHVALGIQVLEGILGFRVGAVFRELDRGFDELVRFAVGLLEVLVRELQALAELRDWILRSPAVA